MSKYHFILEVYDESRIAILEYRSEAIPYTRREKSEQVELRPPHPEYGIMLAHIVCDLVTSKHPYVALRLNSPDGKGVPYADHLRRCGWSNKTTRVVVSNP